MTSHNLFWPSEARLAVSFSLMFEAGGQPTSGAVTVPSNFHMNDIVSFPFQGWNAAAYEQALKDEFDQLYEEGAHRRRMMVVSLHDRISGHATRARSLDRFLAYARSKSDVWFARKDEIAKWALAHRAETPVVRREGPEISGLPGSASSSGEMHGY